MVRDAAENLEGIVGYSEIIDFILSKYGKDVPEDKIDSLKNQIRSCIISYSVNMPSRIHYNENKSSRLTNTGSRYDVFFNVERGKVMKYHPRIHYYTYFVNLIFIINLYIFTIKLSI